MAEEDFIEEILTVASKIPTESKNVLATVDILDASILNKQAPKDVLSILSNSLAIDTSSNGGLGQVASFFLRGSNSNQTLVKVNGVKINPSTSGGASIYNFDTSLISKIEIGSGPFSSIHGSEAIGGVINISTIEDPDERFLVLSLNTGPDNLKKESLSTSWGKKETFLNLSLLNSKTNGFPTLSSSNLNRGYKNKSILSTFTHQTKFLKGQISTWSSSGMTEYTGFEGVPMSQDYKNQVHAIDLSYETNKGFQVLANLGYSKDFIVQKQENFLGLRDLINTDRNSIEIMIHKPKLDSRSFVLGYNLEEEDVDYSSFGTKFKKSLSTNSMFLSSQFQIKDDLVGINFRSSYHELYGNKFSWNLGFLKQINNFWSLMVNSGESFRSPNSSELFGYGSNLKLQPETSMSYELNTIRRVNKNNLLSIVLFKNKTRNLINFDFQDYILKNIEQGKTRGTELRYKWSNKSLQLNVLLRNQDPKDQDGNLLLRRSKRSISLNLNKNYPAANFNVNLSAFSRRQDFGDQILPGYSLFNLAIMKEISDELVISIKLENLFDKEYFTAASPDGYYLNQRRSIWFTTNYTLRK